MHHLLRGPSTPSDESLAVRLNSLWEKSQRAKMEEEKKNLPKDQWNWIEGGKVDEVGLSFSLPSEKLGCRSRDRQRRSRKKGAERSFDAVG